MDVRRHSMVLHTGRALNRVVPVDVQESIYPIDDLTHLSARQAWNRRKLLWGGWTCPNCVTEVDRRGGELADDQ